MPIYNKPVRLLFRNMIVALKIKPGDTIERDDITSWFHQNYPKVKDGTIAAHLLKMSTNARSRVHYNVDPEGNDDLLYQISSKRFRLYDPKGDPQPIYEKGVGGDDETDTEEEIETAEQEREFAYERDLQNFLAKNLSLIEPGLHLYEEEGISGLEFPVGNRRIDILALDQENDYVVIELKVSRGYDRVIGQLLRYIAWIKCYQVDEGQQVRGIIIAREISEDLLLACSQIDNVDLYEYGLSVSLHPVMLTANQATGDSKMIAPFA